MFRSGGFVGEHVDPVTESQIQPNGVDIRVSRIERPVGGGSIERTGKTIGTREEVEVVNGMYELDPGAYVVGYHERIRIPDEHIGFILPRSSLLRNGSTIDTAVWDTGYEGRGEGLLSVGAPIEIEPEARIAQFVLASADHLGAYNGTYQRERLD